MIAIAGLFRLSGMDSDVIFGAEIAPSLVLDTWQRQPPLGLSQTYALQSWK